MSTPDRINLSIPALPQYIRLARVTASGLATRLGFGIDEIEDLRLAVDEACFAVIGTGTSSHELHLSYEIDDHSLAITGKVNTGKVNTGKVNAKPALVDSTAADVETIASQFTDSADAALGTPSFNGVVNHEMTHVILDALVDEHAIEHHDNTASFHVKKALKR